MCIRDSTRLCISKVYWPEQVRRESKSQARGSNALCNGVVVVAAAVVVVDVVEGVVVVLTVVVVAVAVEVVVVLVGGRYGVMQQSLFSEHHVLPYREKVPGPHDV